MIDEKTYGLAVRDDELYLILRIRRDPKGEVFCIFPRDDPDWDPGNHIRIEPIDTFHNIY